MQIINDLSIEQLTNLQKQLANDQVLIVKFSATWCGPCKKIKPVWESFLGYCQSNKLSKFIFAEIDIDESLDLYVALKNKKMVKGVPTILAFYGNVKRDQYYIPDDSFSGGDINGLNNFFQRIQNHS